MSVKRILWLHGERLLLRGLLRESTRCWLLLASELEVGIPELLLKMGSTLGQKGERESVFCKMCGWRQFRGSGQYRTSESLVRNQNRMHHLTRGTCSASTSPPRFGVICL